MSDSAMEAPTPENIANIFFQKSDEQIIKKNQKSATTPEVIKKCMIMFWKRKTAL